MIPSQVKALRISPILGTHAHVLFAICVAISLLIFAPIVVELAGISLASDELSYIVLIVPICGITLWIDREQVFSKASPEKTFWRLGLLAAAVVFSVSILRIAQGMDSATRISVSVLTMIAFWILSFALCYGRASLRPAAFPLLFLLLLLPPPPVLLEKVTLALQTGTVGVANGIFHFAHIPAVHDGYVFTLRNTAVEVSRECSGIRSSTVLLIFALLAGHLMLRSAGRKLFLVGAMIVLGVVKNGLRIVALTAITAYIAPDFLDGNFHRYGGIPLLLAALSILFVFTRYLQRTEAAKQTSDLG